MTSTPLRFSAVNWTPNEMVGERKMDQLSENADWLFQHTPRAIYTLPSGLRRVEGTKIASGRAIITKRNRGSATVEVRFGNFFATGCQPNITTGIVAREQTRIFDSISGLGRLIPDQRGFQIGVEVATGPKKKKVKITQTIYVAWQAMGY